MAKTNPILAAYDRKIRAEYQAQVDQLEADHRERRYRLAEMYMVALMITVHEELKVGPGRAGAVLQAFIDNKKKLAQELLTDVGGVDRYGEYQGDKRFLHTRHDLATALKGIFSPDDWDKYKELFPLLEEYW